jgi:YegS/Rv2252/BmrU family lipid kinase
MILCPAAWCYKHVIMSLLALIQTRASGGTPPVYRRLKYRFIFNPRSGQNARNPRLLQHTRDFIAAHQLDAIVVSTERPHHATELARRAVDEGCAVVVAIGGDGTMNEVGTALAGSQTVLGLIPCGSGNGLGRHLGIYGPTRHVFHTLRTGRIRCIDTGTANGHPFFNAMGLGFDAEISNHFARLTQRGFTAYVRTTLATWRRFQPVAITVQTDTAHLDFSALIVAVANSDQYGNDCYIAPGACVDDGLLDLTVIKPTGLVAALPLAVRLFAGRLDGSPQVTRLRAARFTIGRAAPGLIHTDGECHFTAAAVEVTVRPQSLRVLVPATSD